MKYSERDLRATDILALVLVGIGILLLIVRGPDFVATLGDATSESDKAGEKAWLAHFTHTPGLRPTVIGLVFLCLGVALNLELESLLASGGEEPAKGLESQ